MGMPLSTRGAKMSCFRDLFVSILCNKFLDCSLVSAHGLACLLPALLPHEPLLATCSEPLLRLAT